MNSSSNCIVFLLLVSIAVQAMDVKEEWIKFKQTYPTRYRSIPEEEHRFEIFSENLKKIEEHNAAYENGSETYTLGITQFSDLTEEEFIQTLPKMEPEELGEDEEVYEPMKRVVPASIDWRSKGAVTPVKNQGSCGSCWAFSAAAALESRYFRKTKRLVSLSEQNLVDCSSGYGNHGCNGGWYHWAYNYIKNAGINSEGDYKYAGKVQACKFNSKKSVTKVTGYTSIRVNEADMQKAVAEIGPINIALDASYFGQYKGGVFSKSNCPTNKPTHALVIVGYGREKNLDYWLVKNSWGSGWGEKGYIKIARNRGNMCGIASYAKYPNL